MVRLYKLADRRTSFVDISTGFKLDGGEEKPLPRRRSQLIKDWVMAGGIVPVPPKPKEEPPQEVTVTKKRGRPAISRRTPIKAG